MVALKSRFAEANTDLVLQGLLAISGLAEDDAANATQLGMVGACSGLCAIAGCHIGRTCMGRGRLNLLLALNSVCQSMDLNFMPFCGGYLVLP